jgi:hypothetical protein
MHWWREGNSGLGGPSEISLPWRDRHFTGGIHQRPSMRTAPRAIPFSEWRAFRPRVALGRHLHNGEKSRRRSLLGLLPF